MKNWLFLPIVFFLVTTSLWGATLGDLDLDGTLSQEEAQSLGEKLRANDTTSLAHVDLNLNHRFDENDLQLIEHVIEIQNRSPHSPLLPFFHCLLGKKAMGQNDMKNVIAAVPTVASTKRSASLSILHGYLVSGGGKRTPKASEPGEKINFNPREVAFMLASALLSQEVSALSAGHKHEFGSLAFNDEVRNSSKILAKLESLLSDSEIPNIQSRKWLSALLARTKQSLANAAKKTAKNNVIPLDKGIVVNVPTNVEDSSSVIVQQVNGKVKTKSKGLWKWFLGTFIIGLAAAFFFLSRKGETPVVTKSLPVDRNAPTVLDGKRKQKNQITATQAVAVSGLSHRLAKKLPERYRVVGELGKGGQAVVFLADDVSLNRRVAIKVIDEKAFSGLAVSRFLREAETLASMNHQGIPKIYDLQEKPPFIVMEYIAGQNLWSILRNGRPDFLQGLQWTFELFQLLSHCHEQNIYHRDIKPGNIVISEKGLYLIDFGLVKREDDTQITSEGKMLGTMSYFAPEQFRAAASTHRTELYSAGLVAYELLTGLYPFASSHPFPPQVMQEPRRPRSLAADLHPAFDEFLLSLIEKSPKDRPETVAQAYAQLESLSRKHLRRLPPILSHSSNQSTVEVS